MCEVYDDLCEESKSFNCKYKKVKTRYKNLFATHHVCLHNLVSVICDTRTTLNKNRFIVDTKIEEHK